MNVILVTGDGIPWNFLLGVDHLVAYFHRIFLFAPICVEHFYQGTCDEASSVLLFFLYSNQIFYKVLASKLACSSTGIDLILKFAFLIFF